MDLEKKHIDVVTEGLGIANTSSISAANVVFVKDPADPSLITGSGASTVYSGIGRVTAGTPTAGVVTFDTGTRKPDIYRTCKCISRV